jgi:hypothetical protein
MSFQETARIKMRELSSKNAATRRAAAYYLGEAGVDESITKLVSLYKDDPDKSVRKAAAYSLGMFKAVDIALKRGEDDKVVALLHKVVDDGKFGKRAALPVSAVTGFELLLVIVLVALVAANVLLPGLRPLPIPGIQLPGASPSVDETAILNEMRGAYDQVNNDTTTLQTQFQALLGGSALDCRAFFNNPQPYVLPDNIAQADPELATAAQTLNAAQGSLTAAKVRYDEACDGKQAITTEEIGGLLAPLVTSQLTLSQVYTLLNLREMATLVSATATPAATATTPATATIAPTDIPTVPGPDPRSQLVALYGIIDQVTAPRGANGLLRQYWQDAGVAGYIDACQDPVPPIPDDYVAPPEMIAVSHNLAQAVDQINLGLSLVRQGWQLFSYSCVRRNLSGQATTGTQAAEAADAAFREADRLLSAVRNGAY